MYCIFCRIYLETIDKKDAEIKALSESIDNLRSYIGDVRPTQDVETLNETNNQLTRNIEVLTDENKTLHSTIKLLNVRLSSILEIVSIQEAELTRNGGSECLLRTWREKVFALMVHMQSQAIVQKETTRKEDAKVCDLLCLLFKI